MAALRKVLLGVGGAAGAGYGGYYVIQSRELGNLEKDQKDIESLVQAEKRALQNSNKQIAEQEQKIRDLTKQDEQQRKALKDTQSKLDAARKQVQTLEAEYQKQQEATKKVSADIQSTLSRLTQLKSEGERAKEAATLGEKSLALARQQVDDAKKLLNPLNHPKLRSLLDSKQQPK